VVGDVAGAIQDGLDRADRFDAATRRIRAVVLSRPAGSTDEQYPYLGSDLLAVTDGTVVKVRDGMPNERPNEACRGRQTAGGLRRQLGGHPDRSHRVGSVSRTVRSAPGRGSVAV
jgi:hypothetical protein